MALVVTLELIEGIRPKYRAVDPRGLSVWGFEDTPALRDHLANYRAGNIRIEPRQFMVRYRMTKAQAGLRQ